MKSFLENFTLLSTAIIVGLIVSVVAQVFALTAKYIYDLSVGDDVFSYFNIVIIETELNILPFFSCLLASILVCILIKINKIERWHGPADTIYAAHQIAGTLDTKMGFNSTLASFFSISGGASVGMYGPLVHFGGTLAAYLRRRPFIPNIPHDIIIGAGVAAAISAGFGSPIAGIIFAHEAILRHFSFKAIAPIAVSSVVSSTLANYFFPSGILLQNTSSEISLLPSVSLSLILGPMCAVIAVIFMRSLITLQKYSSKLSSSEFIRILYAVVAVGLIGGFIPEVLGLGSETIVGIIERSYTFYFLMCVLTLKLVVTVVCLSMGFFGGVFSPALVLGAALGGILTYIGSTFGINNIGDSLILAGMAALSASVIGAPIASIVIIFELSHSYDLAFVAIICVAGSCLISSLIFGHSFFDMQLINRNFRISRGRADIVLSEISIKNIIGKNKFLSTTQTKRKELIKLFASSDFTEAYIIEEDNRLMGKIKVNEVMKELNQDVLIDKNPLALSIDESISEAITKASNFVGESIPVLDQSKKLVGVITEADLFLQYLSVQESISNIERD